jgi:hypothetical protein
MIPENWTYLLPSVQTNIFLCTLQSPVTPSFNVSICLDDHRCMDYSEFGGPIGPFLQYGCTGIMTIEETSYSREVLDPGVRYPTDKTNGRWITECVLSSFLASRGRRC